MQGLSLSCLKDLTICNSGDRNLDLLKGYNSQTPYYARNEGDTADSKSENQLYCSAYTQNQRKFRRNIKLITWMAAVYCMEQGSPNCGLGGRCGTLHASGQPG